MASISCVVMTTTWNSVDHIGTFLRHYRALGFDRVFVMDFDSTDGTRDLLDAAEWQGFVEIVPFPGLASLDSSNVMLSIARQRYEADQWCLFCDPDELLVTPAMKLQEPALAGLCANSESISIRRFNMTAPLSIARQANHRLSALDALTLRIDRRHVPSPGQAIEMDTLDPPWVYTAIPGKVMVRPAATKAIGDGDHVASTSADAPAVAPDSIYLLHYPIRGYPAFEHKMKLSRVFHDLNPQLGPHFGWHVRRWMRMADAGKLHDDYLAQFIADEKLEALLADGTLTRDESVAKFHRRLD